MFVIVEGAFQSLGLPLLLLGIVLMSLPQPLPPSRPSQSGPQLVHVPSHRNRQSLAKRRSRSRAKASKDMALEVGAMMGVNVFVAAIHSESLRYAALLPPQPCHSRQPVLQVHSAGDTVVLLHDRITIASTTGTEAIV